MLDPTLSGIKNRCRKDKGSGLMLMSGEYQETKAREMKKVPNIKRNNNIIKTVP